MKPEYEKPIAMPLGKAAKGSGQCNAGSAVMLGAGLTACNNGAAPPPFNCFNGASAENCGSGTSPKLYCIPGYSGPSE